MILLLLISVIESSDDDMAMDNLMTERSDTEVRRIGICGKLHQQLFPFDTCYHLFSFFQDFDDLFLSDTEAATDQAQVNGTEEEEEEEEDMESDWGHRGSEDNRESDSDRSLVLKCDWSNQAYSIAWTQVCDQSYL